MVHQHSVVQSCTATKNREGEKGAMTVRQLKEKLAKLDDKMKVVVCWEDLEHSSDQHMFEIDDVSEVKGTPRRHSNGKAGFTFSNEGEVTWAFIMIDPA